MAGGGGYSASNLSVLLRNQRCSSTASQPIQSFFLPSGSSSASVLGSRSMMSFQGIHLANGLPGSFFSSFDREGNGDDDLEEYFHQTEKKRRLSVDQVQFLEKSFELENKLEPERKIQLARDLGLQPRQIAIWYQNRRARWKTKQLEKDYNALQASYDNLKSDYDSLVKEKDKLKAEVDFLSNKLLLMQKENGSSESSHKDTLSQGPPAKQIGDSASEDEESKFSVLACKPEDISSTKSDTLDSESPHYANGVHSSIIDAGDSSYVFEPDHSDLSQDEDDNLSKNLLPSYGFPKPEDVNYSDQPSSFEDHAFWSWSY